MKCFCSSATIAFLCKWRWNMLLIVAIEWLWHSDCCLFLRVLLKSLLHSYLPLCDVVAMEFTQNLWCRKSKYIFTKNCLWAPIWLITLTENHIGSFLLARINRTWCMIMCKNVAIVCQPIFTIFHYLFQQPGTVLVTQPGGVLVAHSPPFVPVEKPENYLLLSALTCLCINQICGLIALLASCK